MSEYPINILTGCLGSGKTTVLEKLFEKEPLIRTQLIINEFGLAGVDQFLVKQDNIDTYLIDSGCICCDAKDELESILEIILYKIERLDEPSEVWIETSGLSNPGSIVDLIVNHVMLQNHFYINRIITTVDAQNVEFQEKRNPEFHTQISLATHVAITKSDITKKENLSYVRERIEAINPLAVITQCVLGEFDNEDFLETKTEHLIVNNYRPPTDAADQHIQSISITFDEKIDWTGFSFWLSLVLNQYGEDILRVKGILDTGDEFPVNLNGVQKTIHPPKHLDYWPNGFKKSFLVFIVRDIQPDLVLKSLSAFQSFTGSDVKLERINTEKNN